MPIQTTSVIFSVFSSVIEMVFFFKRFQLMKIMFRRHVTVLTNYDISIYMVNNARQVCKYKTGYISSLSVVDRRVDKSKAI